MVHKTIKELEAKLNNIDKMMSLGEHVGANARLQALKDVLELIDEFEKNMHKDTSESFIACWDCIKEELKARITG